VRNYVRNYGLAGMPATWHRVLNSAKRAEDELTKKLRRRPTGAEVKEEVKRYALTWATEHLSAKQRESDAVDDAAKNKLVRQGTWSAIEHLDDIRTSTQTVLSLDAPSGEAGVTLAELIGDASVEEGLGVVQWFLGTLSEGDRELVTRRFGLTGDSSATFEELAESRGVVWTEVRAHLNSLLGRFTAPHAHFIFCDGDFDSRIETEVLDSASSRLASRRAQSRASVVSA
jgi:DNA-directed RNA polymerase sigma subunit (sigma70/sigma32)